MKAEKTLYDVIDLAFTFGLSIPERGALIEKLRALESEAEIGKATLTVFKHEGVITVSECEDGFFVKDKTIKAVDKLLAWHREAANDKAE